RCAASPASVGRVSVAAARPVPTNASASTRGHARPARPRSSARRGSAVRSTRCAADPVRAGAWSASNTTRRPCSHASRSRRNRAGRSVSPAMAAGAWRQRGSSSLCQRSVTSPSIARSGAPRKPARVPKSRTSAWRESKMTASSTTASRPSAKAARPAKGAADSAAAVCRNSRLFVTILSLSRPAAGRRITAQPRCRAVAEGGGKCVAASRFEGAAREAGERSFQLERGRLHRVHSAARPDEPCKFCRTREDGLPARAVCYARTPFPKSKGARLRRSGGSAIGLTARRIRRMSESADCKSADYRSLFEQLPGLFLVLLPDASFTIVDASDAYLRVTFTTRELLIGRGLFDVLPKEPVATRGPAELKLRKSLETVIATGRPDPMQV